MLRLRGERSCSKWFSHFQKFLHWDRFLANDYFAIRDCLDKFGRIPSVNYLIGIIFLCCPDVNMRDISGFVQAFFFKGYILQKLNVIILVKISFHWHFQKLGPHYLHVIIAVDVFGRSKWLVVVVIICLKEEVVAGISSQARYRPHHPNPIILSALTTDRFIVILVYHPLIIMLVETILSTELLLLR